MERKLLLVGMLRAGEAHGYHIIEMLDKHAGTSVLDHQMKHIELDIGYIKALVKKIKNEGIKHHG